MKLTQTELGLRISFLFFKTARAQHNRFIWRSNRCIHDKAVKLYLSSSVDDGFFRHAV
jgi:hypothetical protein